MRQPPCLTQSLITWISRNIAHLLAVAYMASDFNSHSTVWDEHVTWQCRDANILIEIAQLIIHTPTAQRLSVIDLVFLELCEALHIQPVHLEEMCNASDHHMPILTVLLLELDQGPERQHSIKPDSKAEEAFVDQLTAGIAHINVSGLDSAECIDLAVDTLTAVISDVWLCHLKEVCITRHSNPWWENECEVALQQYRGSRSPEDYRMFRSATKQAKHVFFNHHIKKITETHSQPWDLIGWAQQHKLPLCEAIRYHDEPCHTLNELWGVLHGTYNLASGGSSTLWHWMTYQTNSSAIECASPRQR